MLPAAWRLGSGAAMMFAPMCFLLLWTSVCLHRPSPVEATPIGCYLAGGTSSLVINDTFLLNTAPDRLVTISNCAASITLSVTILCSNVSVVLEQSALRLVKLGSAMSTLGNISLELRGVTASRADVAKMAVDVAGKRLENCSIHFINSTLSLVGASESLLVDMVDAKILHSVSVTWTDCVIVLASSSSYAIVVHVDAHAYSFLHFCFLRTTVNVSCGVDQYGQLGMLRGGTEDLTPAFFYLTIEVADSAVWITPIALYVNTTRARAFSLGRGDSTVNEWNPSLSHFTVLMSNVSFHASGARAVAWIEVDSLDFINHARVELVDVRATFQAIGTLRASNTGRIATLLMFTSEGATTNKPNTDWNITLKNVHLKTTMEFGFLVDQYAPELQSLECALLKVFRAVQLQLDVSHCTVELHAPTLPYCVPSIFAQASLAIVLLMINESSQSYVAITSTTVTFIQEKYCTTWRAASGGGIAFSNAGFFSVVSCTIGISRVTMMDNVFVLKNNNVVVPTVARRDDCTSIISNLTTLVNNIPQPLPFYPAFTVGIMCFIGIDPDVIRHNGLWPIFVEVLVLSRLQSFYFKGVNISSVLTNNTLALGNVPSIPPDRRFGGTELRVGHVVVLGIGEMINMTFDVEGTMLNDQTSSATAFSSAPLWFVDKLEHGVGLNLTGRVGPTYSSGLPVVPQDVLYYMNDTTLDEASVMTIRPARTGMMDIEGRGQTPLVVVNYTTLASGGSQLRFERFALRNMLVVVGGVRTASVGPVDQAPSAIGVCMQWEGHLLRRDNFGTNLSVALLHQVDLCGHIPGTRTISAALEDRALQKPRSLPSSAAAFAALGIATGGIVSVASVASVQRAIFLLRLSACSGPEESMREELDVFTNPLRLQILTGGDENYGVGVDNDDGDETAFEFGASYRGAVVGNVAVIWCGGCVVAGAAMGAVMWYHRPLWSLADTGEFLHLPGNLFPILVAPVLQPIMSSALALLLHGRESADFAIGTIGLLFSTSVATAVCLVVHPRWFHAEARHARHKAELQRTIDQLARGASRKTFGSLVKRLWLRAVLHLFVLDYEWIPSTRGRQRRGQYKRRFVGWFGGLFEALRPQHQWVFIAEVVVMVESSVTAAILPADEDACSALAWVDCVANGALVALCLVRRPYGALYDHAAAALMVALTTLLALIVALRSSESIVEAVATVTNVIGFIVVVVGLVGLVAPGRGVAAKWLHHWRVHGVTGSNFQLPSVAALAPSDRTKRRKTRHATPAPLKTGVPSANKAFFKQYDALEQLVRLACTRGRSLQRSRSDDNTRLS